VFLGLDGVVIKSHGSMDAVGTAGAIELGHAMVQHELLGKIRDMLALALSGPGDPVESAGPPSARTAEDAARTDLT